MLNGDFVMLLSESFSGSSLLESLGHGRPWLCSGSYSGFTDIEIVGHGSLLAFHSVNEKNKLSVTCEFNAIVPFLFLAIRFWGRFILV